MKFKKIALILSMIIGVSMLGGCLENGHLGGSLTSASSSSDVTGSGGTILVDLHTLMPSQNETATPDNLYPVNATRVIARNYTALTENNIKWASDYAKPVDTLENMMVWYTNQISVNNCPAIGYSVGTGMQASGYYLDLTEYLERPNPYMNDVKWKDTFQDFVWKDDDCLDASGKIVSIPLVLNPGSATAFYYNKTMFDGKGLKEPSDWSDFRKCVDKLKADGVTYPFVPYSGSSSIALDSWAVRFNIAPGFAKYMMVNEGTDYDGDGKVTQNELLRAVKEGKFNPETSDAARAFYNAAKNYYAVELPTGWDSAGSDTYVKAWNAGKVGFFDQGMWYRKTENNNSERNFEFSLCPPPAVQSTSSSYAADLESGTLTGGFESKVYAAVNIMIPGITTDGSADKSKIDNEKLEIAIDFLMYLTSTEPSLLMCEENDTGLSPLKNTAIPNSFVTSGWADKTFTKITDSAWPVGFVSTYDVQINNTFNSWVSNNISAETFYKRVNDYQQAGADALIRQMNIDTTGWNI